MVLTGGGIYGGGQSSRVETTTNGINFDNGREGVPQGIGYH